MHHDPANDLEGLCTFPDETHDGVSGTEAGLRYRILYLDPVLVQEALGGLLTVLPLVTQE
jgi:hypothetical protein